MIADLPATCSRCGCRKLKWITNPVTLERRWCCVSCGEVLWKEGK